MTKANKEVAIALVSVVIGSTLGFVGNFINNKMNHEFSLEKASVDRVYTLRSEAFFNYVTSLLEIETRMKELPFGLHKEETTLDSSPYLDSLNEAHAILISVSDDEMTTNLSELTDQYINSYLDYVLEIKKSYFDYRESVDEVYWFAFALRREEFIQEMVIEYVPHLSAKRETFIEFAKCDYIWRDLSEACKN